MEPENSELNYAIPQGTIPPSAPKRGFFSASGREKWLALLSFPIAYLYIYWLFNDLYDTPAYWWYLTAFAACFILWTELANRGRSARAERWVWVGAIAVCLAGCLIGRSRVWDGALTALFIHGFAIYYVLCRSDTLLEGYTGRMLPLDAVFGAFAFPFGQFILRLRAVGAIFAEKKQPQEKKRGIWWTVAAVAAAAGLLIWVVSLLRQADTGFEKLFKWTFNWKLSENFSEYLTRFILSLPVGAYLYGLIGGTARMEPATMRRRGGNVLRFFEKLRKVPATVWCVLLGAFAAVYCVFFAVQGSYLFGAFTRSLPEDFTVAEYARQGFFELCKIMALNFVLLFLSLSSAGTAVREHKALRIMATVILVQSLLLAVTAGSKLWLYIDCFGFTPLRLQSAWLICVLAAGVIASLWSVWTNRRSVRAWAIFSGLTLAVLHLF